MVYVLVLLGLLGAGVLLVVYGTAKKNRWGINRSAVSCPRCGTTAPRIRQPQTLRQAMWGGWTCPTCGTEVDKWERETALAARHHRLGAGTHTSTIPSKKRFIVSTAALYVCVRLLLNWVGATGTGFPSTWYGTVVQLGDAAVEGVAFAIFFSLAWGYVWNRLLQVGKKGDAVRTNGSQGDT